ncbi:site-specific DNA-methyltransferase [Acetivibrio thermocellus]|uniref:site-specific DNA-methyltransferase n=1 Tax=Acetivibrio thermocellus TaxID=1515 RepID=UPI0021AD9889|nr:site-specific DNA-methyltransferase [Acetivibrio thermocellus]UWV46350.1 site-specific DNA-methyltransferase [Acetivibrio thermocellus]
MKKLTKEDIDKVRHIEGFPIANDEDIIALSNPPYYTACPNPFIEDFIKEHGKPYDEATDDYHREPFAADVSEGKNDPIYNAHSYHTKVPHKAIMRYILHYTEPGDIVFDGFCGTGMTGVAAQMCGNPDPELKARIEAEMPYVKWGARKAILNDLSPAATFIAYNYNTPVDVAEFEKEAKRILEECEKEYGWMYETQHTINGEIQYGIDGKPIMGRINYTVWSDVFICPTCSNEIVFWDAAVDKEKGKVNDTFYCPHCNSQLTKRSCERAQETHFDARLNEFVTMAKQVPVLINYSVGKKRFEKTPDEYDLALIEKIDNMDIPYWYPTDRMCEGSESRRNDRYGITHVHQFYTKRNLYLNAWLRNKIIKVKDKCISDILLFGFNNVQQRHCKLNAMRFNVSFPSNITSGTLYLPSMIRENNIIDQLSNKYFKRIVKAFKDNTSKYSIVSTNSTTSNIINSNNSIDYIFTDPPFGSNLNYSELNFLWEAWLKVFTNQEPEAIINAVQGKGLLEYQSLMTRCFEECYRVLKPGRWMTVVFHNSQNSVWNAIQESLMRAGFVIADVRTLDKQQGSFKQVTTTSAVKQDLVISAYKPKESFKREFISHAGSEETAWSFIQQHLEKLPVVVVKNGKIELIEERKAYLLYDRMVAYHIMNGIPVPLDATDFYKGLDERFLKRDGMYFLPDQVNEYDTARIVNDVEPIQMELLVTNEKSAIAWLYKQLETPQTYAELQPKFMQEIRAWDKFEKRPELSELLEENFLQNEEGKWYIPDVTKASDVAKLREKKLLKEFEGYLATKGKLKLFRTEAIRVGFAKLWADKNYKLIVETAERLPESVILEDDKLLMYYDLSLGRI